VQAGMQRFRPIMMTALTTVGGMLPLAFSTPTGEGLNYGPFGKTLVGGMTTATILTLVVVPVVVRVLRRPAGRGVGVGASHLLGEAPRGLTRGGTLCCHGGMAAVKKAAKKATAVKKSAGYPFPFLGEGVGGGRFWCAS
jgi:hypothetical protein